MVEMNSGIGLKLTRAVVVGHVIRSAQSVCCRVVAGSSWSVSAVLVDQVDNLIEIVLLGVVELGITGEHRHVALTVADCDSAAVSRPPQTVEWAIAIGDRFSNDGQFSVRINVPDVDEAFSVA